MSDEPRTGGEPQRFGRCTDCGEVYTVQETGKNSYRPIGMAKECTCGNTEFAPFPEE